MKIKQLPQSDFEPLREAAARLSLNESTVRKGLSGTAHLTKIRQGKLIFLDRAEVDAHIVHLIETARAQQNKATDHVWNHDPI